MNDDATPDGGTGDGTDGSGEDALLARWGLSRRSLLKGFSAAGVVTGVASAGSTAAGASNTIAVENARTGADPDDWESWRDDSIVGFTPDFNVAPGASVRFKVRTDATAYSIRIYRLGWYGGRGARLVDEINPSAPLPQVQPAPVADPSTLLVDCGNWETSATWRVPDDAVSGVYYALFRRQDTQRDNFALFVVRSKGPSDILVQTSDSTWQAYNRFGGASLYWSNGIPPTHLSGRAWKVSYNRPLDVDEVENDFFSTEYALVRFLERNGYDVSYCSQIDTHENADLISRSKVFVSSGHDEYWSGQQRANVTAARDSGTSLVFMTGNEVFWRTRFEPSIDGTNTPNRTLVCYKETLDNAKIDPSPEWTGTWRDLRFRQAGPSEGPEHELTGQLFRCINPVNQPDSPIEVPGEFGKLRFWRNTDIAALDPTATATLTGSTLGYEWDEVVDDEYRPAGLIRLSRTTAFANQVLQDNGATYLPGTLTHHLSLYRAASGALVFGAGTVQWAYGLDEKHRSDPGVPADRRIRQATVNLLADMGAQPSSLMAGLVRASASTDTVPPTASVGGPAAGSDVPIGSAVTVWGSAVDSGGGVVASVEVSTDGGSTWRLAEGTDQWQFAFTPMVLGEIEVLVRATDDSCNTQTVPARLALTGVQRALPAALFADTEVPAVRSSGDPSPIEIGTRISPLLDGFLTGVRFYKGEGNTGIHTASIWSDAGVRLATADFEFETASGWQTVSVPPVPVKAGTTYVASVFCPNGHYSVDVGFFQDDYELWPLRAPANGASGANGVFRYGSPGFPVSTWAASNYWVDAVFHIDDARAPVVNDRSPARGLQSVSPDTVVTARFSEAVDAASIQFELRDPAGAAVPGSQAYDRATRTMTFTPDAPLTDLTTYTAVVLDALDNVGDTMAGPDAWSFSTIGVPGTSPASLWDTSVVPAAVGTEAAAVELGTRITVDVAGVVTALRFHKAEGSEGPHVGHLWDAAGTLLATAIFGDESASGWQQANLETPVELAAGSTVVASYHCPSGVYSFQGGGLADTQTRGQLRAPGSTSSAPNGVYRYGPSGFPSQTWVSTNYFADIVFEGTRPVVPHVMPSNGLQGVDPAQPVVVTFDAPVRPDSLELSLTTGGSTVPAEVGLDPTSTVATLTPSAPLAEGAVYRASVLATGANGSEMAAPVESTFTVATAAGASPATLWTTATVPAVAAANDGSAIEVGTRFAVERKSLVTAIRFHKGPGNNGPHVGHLWNDAGELLGAVVFGDTSAIGWHQADLPQPVPVVPGRTYVASYHAPNGRYSVEGGYFAGTARERSPLVAPASSADAGNGLYAYGAGGFPNGTYGGSCYFVDVVVTDSLEPGVAGTSPSAGATDVAVDTTVSVTFDEPVDPGSVQLGLRDAAGATVPVASVGYDGASRTATLVPAAPLAPDATYTASVTAVDVLGNAMGAPFVWSFSTVGGSAATLFGNAIPAVVASGDTGSVELGMKFSAAVPGRATGVRFHKARQNTGPHSGRLWTTDGQLLATATFGAETAAGWQQARFDTAVDLVPGQVYVVSYHAPAGNYSVDGGFFAGETVSGDLRAPSSSEVGGNGVYGYGPAATFPSGSYNAANYWVDVVFEAD